ncbi:MAG: addiction module protein [Bacteroidota bacterium]
MTVETLIEEYHKLSEIDKERFITLLSLEEDELSPEWKAEIDRRWANFKAGKTIAQNSDDVDQRLARKYGLRLEDA